MTTHIVATIGSAGITGGAHVTYSSAISGIAFALYRAATAPGIHPRERTALLADMLCQPSNAPAVQRIKDLGLRYRNAVLDDHDPDPTHIVEHAELDEAIRQAATDAVHVIADAVLAFRETR